MVNDPARALQMVMETRLFFIHSAKAVRRRKARNHGQIEDNGLFSGTHERLGIPSFVITEPLCDQFTVRVILHREGHDPAWRKIVSVLARSRIESYEACLAGTYCVHVVLDQDAKKRTESGRRISGSSVGDLSSISGSVERILARLHEQSDGSTRR